MKFKSKLLVFSLLLSITSINADPVLFNKFPNLKEKIAHISLCDLPTPVVELKKLREALGYKNLFIKRDDLTGKRTDTGSHLYGGNKPRKLEFLLADAKRNNAKTIITYGCAGSNHALATAVYAKELNLYSILMLKNQPNSPVVRHNLLLDLYCNAQLKFFPNNQTRNASKDEILKNDKDAYFIPTGGSNAIGAMGFVNASFELASQIALGDIQEPELIYVAASPVSGATTAGLLLGIKAAGLKSKIVAVCVEPEDIKDEFLINIKSLFEKTNLLLNSSDSNFPIFEFPENDLILNKKFMGTEYGLYIPEDAQAIKFIRDIENIKIEGTYTAKPVAAIIDDIKTGVIKDETVLFWNTYCGIDYSYLTEFNDYKKLPDEFHKYFEEDVQPLSKI